MSAIVVALEMHAANLGGAFVSQAIEFKLPSQFGEQTMQDLLKLGMNRAEKILMFCASNGREPSFD